MSRNAAVTSAVLLALQIAGEKPIPMGLDR